MEYEFFADPLQRKRYAYAFVIILCIVGSAKLFQEKEINFPEMAAPAIGMWIVDKRVWRISRPQSICFLTMGAVAGVCIVRYSPFPLILNLSLAFIFAAICLILSRTTLIPVISACMLPVLLHTESWFYPAAVLCMSCIIA